ncbi:MAG: ArsR family transcriptional regulator [Anaerolineales bacterium]|nr:ArsR family transcriptional regulator [Anaerolineales bacterium]MCS7247359.1 ArsR family transcriptional regulator [Anaerolineales bacterium]MDW8161170.1 ArsR family transcriptional regulator [Anaerolineales bacterium]MDW8447450.1 ArsR family transcriptional regulator [Anaerolineales bacterium]
MAAEENDHSDPPLIGEQPALLQYIKNLGLYLEEYNVPTIGGEILGLLSIAHRPLSQDEMMEVLDVSRSSISTNLRSLLMAGLVERVSVVGERSDAFVLSEDILEKLLDMRLKKVENLCEVAESGLSALPEGHPARQRVQKLVEWAKLLETVYQDLLERWKSKWGNN